MYVCITNFASIVKPTFGLLHALVAVDSSLTTTIGRKVTPLRLRKPCSTPRKCETVEASRRSGTMKRRTPCYRSRCKITAAKKFLVCIYLPFRQSCSSCDACEKKISCFGRAPFIGKHVCKWPATVDLLYSLLNCIMRMLCTSFYIL